MKLEVVDNMLHLFSYYTGLLDLIAYRESMLMELSTVVNTNPNTHENIDGIQRVPKVHFTTSEEDTLGAKGKRGRDASRCKIVDILSLFVIIIYSFPNTTGGTGTPQTYAKQISSFSRRSTKDSFYPGEHYRSLAQFLSSAYLPRKENEDQHTKDEMVEFLTIHELNHKDENRMTRFGKLETFETYSDKCDVPQILFLRGYPSSHWLCSIGAKYNVDPEFFFRHFNFSAPGMSEYCSLPPQPSSTNVIQLCITSLGRWDTLRSGESIDSIRSSSEGSMTAYLEDLRNWRNVGLSDSIMRRFHLHDTMHFSLEQNISIHLNSHEDKWVRKSSCML